jgi:hypothetical protein
MSFSIRAARQGVHIQQNPNTVPTASGDKVLTACHALTYTWEG